MNRTSPPLSSPSELESKLYYAGMPTAPILVARSSTTREAPIPGPRRLGLQDTI